MFVQIARIAKRSQTVLALERFKSGVSANVNFQPVLSRIQLPAVDADVALLRRSHVADDGLQVGSRDHGRFVHQRVMVMMVVYTVMMRGRLV